MVHRVAPAQVEEREEEQRARLGDRAEDLALLVELDDLAQTLALLASLQAEPIEGIEELVPAARTILVRFRPGAVTHEARVSCALCFILFILFIRLYSTHWVSGSGVCGRRSLGSESIG